MTTMTTTMTALQVRSEGWTVDDLEELPEELRYELVDGGLLMSPSPAVGHGYAQVELAALLRAAVGPEHVVVGETGLRFDRRNERRPDLAVVRRSALGSVVLSPSDVLLVVEVMSPGSVSTDRVAKPAQYAAAGIPAYWRLEQDEGVLVTHVLDGDTYRETGRHTGPAVVEEPFRVELDVATLLV